VEESLVDTSRLFSSLLTDRMGNGEDLTFTLEEPARKFREDRFFAQIYDASKTESDLQFYVTDSQGIILFHSHRNEEIGKDYSRWNDVRLTLEGEYGARSTRLDPDDPSTSQLHVAAPIVLKAEIVGVLTVIKPIGWPYQFMEEARFHILKGVILITVATFLVAFLLSRWLTNPIEKITGYAARVSRGERAALPRLGVASEVKRLGRAVEDMKNSLEGKKYVESYVASLTHEIKSPMSGIRAAAEILKENPPEEKRQQFLEIIRTEGDRVHRIIDQMLTLVELEGAESLDKMDRIEIHDLAKRVCEEFRAQAEVQGIYLQVGGTGGGVIQGDRRLLEIALSNLLSNALAFTPEGGTVAVETGEDERSSWVSVKDSGPGIPDYARSRVFERFYSLPRPNGGKKSSGLGLTLAQEIASLHGGRVELVSSSTEGTNIQIVLGHFRG